MTSLWKKLWGFSSDSNRPYDWNRNQKSMLSANSSSSRSQSQAVIMSSTSAGLGMGVFDDLPVEILSLIVRKVGPREAAKLCHVCRGWRTLISSDNRLWVYFLLEDQTSDVSQDSIFFSETHLRSGRNYHRDLPETLQSQQLSFMQIYGLRAKVPGAVLIDGGSGYCKFGWSKFDRPSGRSATFMEFGNIETPIHIRLRYFYDTIYGRMQVKPTTQPIVVSIPICHYDNTESAKASRRQMKEAVYSTLFDMNVPVVCAINQATLALYAARRTSGIVVNIGFRQTSVVPILQGKIMCQVGVESIGLGALKLTGFLREQMQQNSIAFESLYTIRELKENLCYVAYDYQSELSKHTEASYEVSGEGVFTLSKERFQTGEILFQPRIAGMRAMGLHQAVALCIEHCHDAELTGEDTWFKTIQLSGGSACLPGLSERLEKELRDQLPPSLSNGIRVFPPPHGADSAWFGAKLIANLSSFPRSWCMTEKQFKHKYRRKLTGLLW